MSEETEQQPEFAEAQEKKGRRLRNVIIAAAAVVVVAVVAIGVFVGHSLSTGDLAPVDAAAKYGASYLPEGEVTDYIELYRQQMGLAESSDEDWATFMAAYNLTPTRLRLSTINQLIKDRLVEEKAAELGISASEEEVDASVGTLRDSLGLGDDEILRQTLASRGQTEEGLREVYRKAIVQKLVLSSEVPMPTPTDDQVKAFMKNYDQTLSNSLAKHTYCFKLVGLDEGGSRERVTQAQQIHDAFEEGERSAEVFNALVQMYSEDDDLVSSGGANGWSIDASGYSEAYVNALENTELGGVSSVFVDGDSYAFIWVDETYELPIASDDIDALNPNTVPESLWAYLSDSAAYELWEQAGQDYLDQLLEDANVVYYPMPADVPYNVDMSLADVQLEEIDD